MRFRLRWFALAGACLFSLTGCQAAIRVGVDTNDHGGGRVIAVVTLDRDAQKLVGDLKGQLKVDDLTAAGWKVVGPEKIGSDVRVTATKAFNTPAGATRAVHELDANKGLFKNFTVTQHKTLLRTTTSFHGTVDLRQGIESFSDAALDKKLGSPLGATPAEFEKRIGTAVGDALPITVGVLMPGKVSSNAPVEGGGSAAWHPKLGDRIELVASSKQLNTKVIALGAVAILAAGTALIFGLGGRRGRRGRATPSL
ncbi:MAG: hypothetical protein QOJ00_33 [Actinomycetota bacterium]